MKNFIKFCLLILFVCFAADLVCGQNDITITRDIPVVGNSKPIPVSLEGFSGEAAEVLKFDLYVQGFSNVAPADAQYQISGSNSGNVTGSVTDKFAKKVILSRSYTGGSLRSEAHAFANEIVEAITGKPGISLLRGSTAKIAFKAQPTGNGPGEIYISDFDGHNPQVATPEKTIVAAPSWVPGRRALCYNSYAVGDNPYIFYHDYVSGQRKIIARYGGSNISPSVSPDGTKVAMVLDKDGDRPNIYVANIDGSNARRLTTGEEDSSPCWSPDGKWICYATKIDEHRCLAKISATATDAKPQRISTSGVLNPTEPDWSPDGKWIAFTSQMGGFNICVMPADGGTVVTVATGEDPSWAPNSRTVIFARRGDNYIYTLSVLDVFTKQAKDIGRISGSDSEPAWAR